MASKAIQEDADEGQRGFIGSLIATVKNALLTPIRPFISRTALKAYLTTLLLIVTAFVLLGFAIAAYILFYWSYIPRIGFERTINLQFDNVYKSSDVQHPKIYPYPYGSASLAPDLVAAQGYDIWIELAMPRTRDNQDAGNFMLEVNMYAPSEKGGESLPETTLAPLQADIASSDPSLLLATSRRPAILPYRSLPIDLLHKATELPWSFLLGSPSESHALKIPVFERATFPKGAQKIPATLRLEIQSTHRLQIYSARALFRARFRGLRWIMYNHRIIAGTVFISAFWITEMLFAALAWGALHVILSKSSQEAPSPEIKADEVAQSIKREAGVKDDEVVAEADIKPELSDTERTFPSFTGQPALRYQSPPVRVKSEQEDEHTVIIPEKAAEADDEDEDVDDFLDSGIGTSLESSGPARRESMRRRRGRPPPAGGSQNVWRDEDDEEQ